jgi:Tol biopolymer transport system component
MKKIVSLLVTVVFLTSCLPGDMQVPQSPLLPLLERKSGRIAYIGADGNIYTSDQAGGDLIAHTDDAQIPEDPNNPYQYYVNPTWSHDSEKLGFVRVSGQGSDTSAGIYIANVEEETAEEVYSSDQEQPFYLYWSPDNTNLSFISSTANGQSMVLQSVSTDREERTIIDTGSPYYWSWAPNGETMIVHTGSTQSTVPEHLAFLQVDTEILEHGVETFPATFQAPAWSPDGSRILMTRLSDDDEKEIILTNSRGEFERSIATYDLNTAFAWSYDSSMAGYIEGEQTLGAGTLGTLHVVDIETSESLFDAENVFGFFWSPDDEKIAYFVPVITNESSGEQSEDPNAQTGQILLLQLNILDLDRGESKELFTFRPTDQFAGIMPYFDQYHQSATIWSPDSNKLVLSFVTSDGQAGIAVVAASGQLEPRLLAPGYLAFWSWE